MASSTSSALQSSPSSLDQAKTVGNNFTRSRFFQALVNWAYGVCDSSGMGHLNKDELYAGLLLVHVKLAKFAGPAACFVS